LKFIGAFTRHFQLAALMVDDEVREIVTIRSDADPEGLSAAGIDSHVVFAAEEFVVSAHVSLRGGWVLDFCILIIAISALSSACASLLKKCAA
jgi:hypothetical protein